MKQTTPVYKTETNSPFALLSNAAEDVSADKTAVLE